MLWLQRNHFDFDRPWENVSFRLLSAFDVVGASGWSVEMTSQHASELWLLEGTCEIEQNGERALAKTGDLVLLRAGQSRRTQNVENTPISIIGFSFSSQLLGHIDFMALLGPPLCFSSDVERIRPWFSSLLACSREENVQSTLQAQAWAQLILGEVLASQSRQHRSQHDWQHNWQHTLQNDLRSRLNPHVVRVLEHIARHYAEPLHVEDLARVAHLSPKHLARIFKQSIGSAPSDYLRSFRLGRAREMLLRGEKSVSQIAHECGFDDAAYFSRAFKQHFAMSPQEYRQQYRQHMRE